MQCLHNKNDEKPDEDERRDVYYAGATQYYTILTGGFDIHEKETKP